MYTACEGMDHPLASKWEVFSSQFSMFHAVWLDCCTIYRLLCLKTVFAGASELWNEFKELWGSYQGSPCVGKDRRWPFYASWTGKRESCKGTLHSSSSDSPKASSKIPLLSLFHQCLDCLQTYKYHRLCDSLVYQLISEIEIASCKAKGIQGTKTAFQIIRRELRQECGRTFTTFLYARTGQWPQRIRFFCIEANAYITYWEAVMWSNKECANSCE